jgi:DNA polymerase elongation subunit (family B)
MEDAIDLSGLSEEGSVDLDGVAEPEKDRLTIVTIEYEDLSGGGKGQRPVLYLSCRNQFGEYRLVTVEGFRPFFMISLEELRADPSKVVNDRHVRGVEVPESLLEVDGELARFEHTTQKIYTISDGEVPSSLDGRKLCKVFTNVPGDVPDLRDNYEETWEADVPFTSRFLVSTGINRGFECRTDRDTVRYENMGDDPVREIEPCDPPDVTPRILTVDIEVATEGDGFPSVQRAKKPVTAVTAHDSFYDDYRLWYLDHPEWDERPAATDLARYADSEIGMEIPEENIEGFAREVDMLDAFSGWVAEREFDVLTGWNSSGGGGFDYPYLLNRCYNQNVWSISDWNNGFEMPFTTNRGEDRARVHWPGMGVLDMLEGYEKTQYTELRSSALEAVSQEELGMGKVPLEGDLDENWRDQPMDFLTYNVRDVEAVVEIEGDKGIVSMLDDMRDVTGAEYDEMLGNNYRMIDMLFMHRALEWGYALPTNEEPEQGNFHGGYVFSPEPGVHSNVVYLDLHSMYPSIMAMLNISPEVMYQDMESVREDGYTADDVYTGYVDRRAFKEVEKGKEVPELDTDKFKGAVDEEGSLRKPPGILDPQYDEIYYLKRGTKQGFIGTTTDELVEMKDSYKGEDIYGAVKTVVNSVFGVLGDANTGGTGFRLFDHRMAETITLTGQRVIQFTGRKAAEEINKRHPEANARIVVGDTDGVGISVPGAPDEATAVEWAQDVVEDFHSSDDGRDWGYYDEYVHDKFNVDPEDPNDQNKLEVEVESLARRAFFVQSDEDPNIGVKKRYAQDIIWNDSEGGTWYHDTGPEDRIDIKGFEAKRSDSSIATEEVQTDVLVSILTMDEERDEYIRDTISTYVEEIRSGERPVSEIARPKGINQDLEHYGWEVEERGEGPIKEKVKLYPKAKPGPAYRGAKYADTHLTWENIGSGSKPLRLYLEGVSNEDYPAVYEYGGEYDEDSLEVGEEVDAISVDNPERLPEGFKIDYDKMTRKEIEEKVEPVLRTLGLDWGWVMGEGKQSGLSEFS